MLTKGDILMSDRKKMNKYKRRQLGLLVLCLIIIVVIMIFGIRHVLKGGKKIDDTPKSSASSSLDSGISGKGSSKGSASESGEPVGGEPEGGVKITPDPSELNLKVGESETITLTFSPEDVDKTVLWESSDSGVATVNSEGTVTAVGEGKCTIKVNYEAYNGASVEIPVTVEDGEKKIEEREGLTYIDGILVVNKSYSLPSDYAPGLDPEAEAAFNRMAADAANEGLNIWIASGYRSYEYQNKIYNNYSSMYGSETADTFSARPGHSEHQTGLAIDMNSIDDSFADTPESEWVKENCYKYGFIIRYPKDKEDITGYKYEPWHVRYLGEDAAEKVYNSGLTLEEYLGIDSKYSE